MANQIPSQGVRIFDFTPDKSLVNELNLHVPAPYAHEEEFFQQVRYIQNHVTSYLEDLGEPRPSFTVVIEDHYIDHHFMADFAAFYSRSFAEISNACKRVHFFRGSAETVRAKLRELRLEAQTSIKSYRNSYRKYSEEAYLGFTTIKPLPGTPVGSTVLKPYAAKSARAEKKQHERHWPAVRPYRVHLMGVELRVEGLAFQQQDVGVAACATTAIWSALQRARYHEDMPQTTPAMITTHATNAYTRGRAMPSEGLSLEQMSAAVSAVGLSPIITSAQKGAAFVARAVIHSSLLSGQAPILLLHSDDLGNHAATAVGYFTDNADQVDPNQESWRAEAMTVQGLYLHDDRHGPYVRLDFETTSSADGPVRLQLKKPGATAETWELKAVLTPTHKKIRLSFPELYELLAGDLLTTAQSGWAVAGARRYPKPSVVARVYTRRNYEYTNQLLGEDRVDEQLVERLATNTPLPRYLAILRLILAPSACFIDIILDSTSTVTSPTFLAVLTNAKADSIEAVLATALGEMVNQEVIVHNEVITETPTE